MMLASVLVFGLAAWAPQHGARPAVLSRSVASRSCVPLASADAESALSTDVLIQQLREANAQKVQQLLAENIRAIDQSFWMRVADLADAAAEDAEKDALADFASMIAREVEHMIAQAEKKLDTDAVSVQELLKVVADADGQFALPIPEERLEALREELQQRPGLDDGFVATIKAYMKKADEDSLDDIVEVLRQMLQVFASERLMSLVEGRVADEALAAVLATVLKADPAQWEDLLRKNLLDDDAECGFDEFQAVLQDKIGEVVLGMPAGSTMQALLAEYLNELLTRARALAADA